MAAISDLFSGGTRRAPDHDSHGGDGHDFHRAEKPKRDPKKFFLVLGLGILSWVATYVGMLELIEANMGELPLVHKVIIGFSVAMLMTMIVWLLDQIFAPNGFITRLLYVGGYVFLSVISVGFGFGFYWKVLESRSEASRSAESAVAQVQGSLNTAVTRLEQLSGTLTSLTAISTQKADQERANGTSCPNSKPGEGPRRKMREDDAARFSFAADFVKGRVSTVKTEMAALDVDLARIAKDDKSIIDAKSGTRNEFMRGLSRKLDMTVTGFNAFRTDPQLKQIRSDLAERADKTTIADGKGGQISCPDPQLSGALKGVVRAIDQLPEMQKPTIATVEGSEATIEAFRRLTTSFYGLLSFKMPPSADELRALQQKAVQSVETPSPAIARSLSDQAGLSKRDYVPLAIAIFVDVCLLLVSMGRPINRLQGLVPKMVAAERGPVYQILSRFTDIHADAEMRQKFEIFRHVVFDYGGDYYVAVPLDAPWNRNPREQQDLLAEAHLLSNLFSSFEKEKIFKRVYSPFLSTSSIQKKLGRQGSKFSNCKAFRIYRFADGAWSEIILGAVMGAAKRVESEKRKRRLREGHDLPMPETAQASAIAGAFQDVVHQVRPPAPVMRRAQPPAAPQSPHGDHARTPHRFAPPSRPQHPVEAAAAPLQPQARPAMPAQGQPMGPAEDVTAAFGPYARYQPSTPDDAGSAQRDAQVAQWADEVARREAEVSVRAVEPVQAPHQVVATPAPQNVVVMPMRPAVATIEPREQTAPGVDVEMTRETIRYTLPAAAQTTMPTTAAVLPDALARLAAAVRSGEPAPRRLVIDAANEIEVADPQTKAIASRLAAAVPAE